MTTLKERIDAASETYYKSVTDHPTGEAVKYDFKQGAHFGFAEAIRMLRSDEALERAQCCRCYTDQLDLAEFLQSKLTGDKG
jgi:hypothetical protein